MKPISKTKLMGMRFTIITVALGSLGISISFPTGPVILTSAPGLRSPGEQTAGNQFKSTLVNGKKKKISNSAPNHSVIHRGEREVEALT